MQGNAARDLPFQNIHAKSSFVCVVILQGRRSATLLLTSAIEWQAMEEGKKGASALGSSPSGAAAADKKGGAAAQQLGLIKRGATDLKQRLQEASAAQQALVLLWTSAADERACDEATKTLKRAVASHPGQPTHLYT